MQCKVNVYISSCNTIEAIQTQELRRKCRCDADGIVKKKRNAFGTHTDKLKDEVNGIVSF